MDPHDGLAFPSAYVPKRPAFGKGFIELVGHHQKFTGSRCDWRLAMARVGSLDGEYPKFFEDWIGRQTPVSRWFIYVIC